MNIIPCYSTLLDRLTHSFILETFYSMYLAVYGTCVKCPKASCRYETISLSSISCLWLRDAEWVLNWNSLDYALTYS
jgi:hypothetical protein